MDVRQVEAFARQYMTAEPGHDFEHVNRVRNWVLRIAEGEGYEPVAAVEAAALLHDVGLPQAKDRRDHGRIGADMARAFLTERGWFGESLVEDICHAIEFHCTNRGGNGKLLDILRDADMMDMFGAMGIIRAIAFKPGIPEYDPTNVKSDTWEMTAKDFDVRFDSGVRVGGTTVDYFNFHISCYDNLATDTARAMAKPMVAFVREFVLQLEEEVGDRG